MRKTDNLTKLLWMMAGIAGLVVLFCIINAVTLGHADQTWWQNATEQEKVIIFLLLVIIFTKT